MGGEELRGVAVTVGVLLAQKEGNIRQVVEAIGGTMRVPQMDDNRIHA